MFGLLQWHFTAAPQWLVIVTWNLERAAARYFSAGLMLRTLIAHWHKDAVSYEQGTIDKIALAFVWNLISRAIGLCVRLFVLAVYALVAIGIMAAGTLMLLLFLLWPALAISGVVLAIQLLFYALY